MGGNHSKFKCGGVEIKLDQSYYYAGTQVNGTIYVHIDTPFPAQKITLKIRGREKVQWKEEEPVTKDDGHLEWQQKSLSDSHDIFKLEYDIYHFAQGLIPYGQYEFPFAFVLPKNCPSSAHFTCDSGAEGIIEYSCKVKFKADDHYDIADMKYKCPFVVREIPNFEPSSVERNSRVNFSDCDNCKNLGQ